MTIPFISLVFKNEEKENKSNQNTELYNRFRMQFENTSEEAPK